MAGFTKRQPRAVVDGKFFRLGARKLYLKGVSYGPFAPDSHGESFGSAEQAARDFAQIRELGANLVRVYHVPPRWLLDLALAHELTILVDIPWNKSVPFLDRKGYAEEIRQRVREAVRTCAGHPAIFAFSLANEIPPDVVRWSGGQRVSAFIDELVDVAKAEDPACLCTFSNFPPTEYLRPQRIDFYCFNVYLHQAKAFDSYLARLQMIANNKPLILGEFGMDSLREGEERKSDYLRTQIETIFRNGLAGAIVYSFTDDWFTGGCQIENWSFGLTHRDRRPKPSYVAVRDAFGAAPFYPLPRFPRVSVVVASYNGMRTLKTCLDSLSRLNYPDYEVILVDDGSTDQTQRVASFFREIKYVRQPHHGLAVARNTGLEMASGEVVAYTDSDCRADEDWLYYLVGDLLRENFVGVGGHNFLPPDDSVVAAAVQASPGGPAHVMLTDRVAEHIPGCNMAFYRWALEEIGGFDAVYQKAGDDVDVCWRLQQRGYQIGFSPGGFVWHYRRSTIQAYLRQQQGYGEAEALLVREHPEYFNTFGGSMWKGRIYTASQWGLVFGRPVIYHGLFGSGYFQALYAPQPVFVLMFCTSLEYHVLVVAPLLILSAAFPLLLPLGLASLFLTATICVAAAGQAELPRGKTHFWSRPLIALLYFLQPLVRGWARYHGRLRVLRPPASARERLKKRTRADKLEALEQVHYWAPGKMDRLALIRSVHERLDAQGWHDRVEAGWSNYDLEIFGNKWSRLYLTTVLEIDSESRQLLHCRLNAVWSLSAKILFWSVTGLEMVIIGILAPVEPWLWMLLLTIPLLGWFLEQEKRTLQRLLVAFLDDAARDWGLRKMEWKKKEEKFSPASSQ